MRVEQSQQNTQGLDQLVIAEKPIRKNPRRKLSLSTRRYSRRRLAMKRLRDRLAKKRREESGEQMCQIENILSEQTNFEPNQLNLETEELNCQTAALNCQTATLNCQTAALNCNARALNFKTDQLNCKTAALNFNAGAQNCKTAAQNFNAGALNCKTAARNFKAEAPNIKTEQLNCKTAALNCKTAALNFNAGALNCKTAARNFKAEAPNIKTEQLNLKIKEENLKIEDANVAIKEEDLKIEEDFDSDEENFKTEEDFVAYIDLVFNVLEEKRIKQEPKIESEGNGEYILPHGSDNVTDKTVDEYCFMNEGLNCTPHQRESLYSEIENEKLVIEKCSNYSSPKKRYSNDDALSIVNLQHVFEQIKAASAHSDLLRCSADQLQITDVRRKGLGTSLVLTCTMCHYRSTIQSLPADSNRMDINESAVAGTIISGGGYAQMEQLMTALNVPCMNSRTYRKCHDKIVDVLIRAAEIEMVAAAEEEKQLAIERGDVLPCGIPHIPVVADGSWIKRSYGTGKFDSASGAGIIIGFHSKKVLFLGVRNKNCVICHKAKKNNTTPRQHTCFKNWDHNLPSTRMESDAILEGFQTSIATRGLVYSTLIADGDSSMYKKILDTDPYRSMVRVKKIECTNHLLRNFCKKMREIVKKTPPGRYRRAVQGSICRMRTAIQIAGKFRQKEDLEIPQKLENLRGDIINVPSHTFGEHKECQKIGYFCKAAMNNDDRNIVPELVRLGVYQRIQEILRPLLSHAESLLYNRTNNSVESLNAIIAKFTGGKRLNFSQRGSYLARCSAAVIQYNTKEVLSCINRVLMKDPSSVVVGTETRRKHIYTQSVLRRKQNRDGRHVRKLFCTDDDPDYGPSAVQPDIQQLVAELGIKQIDDTSDMIPFENLSSPQIEIVIECVGDAE